MTLIDELSALVKAFDAAGVEYALVGGLALAVWGAARATQDIDLLVHSDGIDAAKRVARSVGFVLEALPMTFRDGMQLQRSTKVAPGAQLMLDLILVNDNLAPVWASRRRLPFADGTISVVSRDALVAMKLAAGRPQDLADVERLNEVDR